MRLPVLIGALGMAATLPLAAQAPLPRPTNLVTGHLHNGTVTYDVLHGKTDSTLSSFATLTKSTALVNDSGKPSLLRVSVFRMGERAIIDSMLTRRNDLAGVWEVSHQPTKDMRLNFNGARVTGAVTTTNGKVDTVDASMAEPAYNSSDTDIIVASLPFKPGLKLALPIYIYEQNGLVVDTVNVVGRESLTLGSSTRPVWRVEKKNGTTVTTYWIDADTREALRTDITYPTRGTTLRIIRKE